MRRSYEKALRSDEFLEGNDEGYIDEVKALGETLKIINDVEKRIDYYGIRVPMDKTSGQPTGMAQVEKLGGGIVK